MNKKERMRVMKRRKREMKYAAGVAKISLAAAMVLFVVIIVAIEAAPSFLRPKISDALIKRDFEKAEKLSGYIGEEEVMTTQKRITYIKAEDLLKEGRYDDAAAMFTSLGSFLDSLTRAMEAGYKKAENALESNEYLQAAELFAYVGGYSDAMDRRSECFYRYAQEKLSAGELDEALKYFTQLGDYLDSAEMRVQTAIALTGIEDGEEAILASMQMSQEELEQLSLLNDMRGRILRGWVAVGYEHTAARKADGTCVAAGDNTYGQTDVSNWHNVSYIDCGAAHTVALLDDGTCVAAGDNTYGQSEVSAWQNVRAISAGAYDTYAVTYDGKLLHTGFSDIEEIEGWSGLTEVSAGSYAVCALYRDGSMLSSKADMVLIADEALYETDVSTAYSAAVTMTGDALTTFDGLNWSYIAMISAGSSGVMGIDADGNVLSHFFRDSVSFEFEDAPALLVAAGGAHHAVLYEDGTVKVYGQNTKGQAETDGWNLFN